MGDQAKAAFLIWLALLGYIPAACSPGAAAPTNTSLPLVTATLECRQTPILPQIGEIQPAIPMPGSEITVIGAGGYVQDSCGGYIEGSREFTLYLDSEPVGSISCYANRCEGKFTLPNSASIGLHCIIAGEVPAVGPDQCPFEFEVIQK